MKKANLFLMILCTIKSVVRLLPLSTSWKMPRLFGSCEHTDQTQLQKTMQDLWVHSSAVKAEQKSRQVLWAPSQARQKTIS